MSSCQIVGKLGDSHRTTSDDPRDDRSVEEDRDGRFDAIAASNAESVDDGLNGTAASATATAAVTPAIGRGLSRADDAGKVARTILDISSPGRVPVSRSDRSSFLKAEAARTRLSTGPTGKSGARGRLKGHLFEDLDIAAYNATGKATGHRLSKRANPRQQTYDADRYVAGKYAGSVQHKASVAGADSAITKMDKRKAGSARKGTIRVPGDQAEATRERVRGRARVHGSEITTEKLNATLDTGLEELAKGGARGASKTRVAVRGVSRAAVTSAAIGGLTDARALVRGELTGKTFAARRTQEAGQTAVATTVSAALERVGSGTNALRDGAARSAAVTLAVSSLREVPALVRSDLSGRDFLENRAIDAAETATAAALGTAATGAILATAGGAAGAANIGAAAASLSAAAAGSIGGFGSVGATVATSLGTVSAAAAGPAIVGGVVVLGTGFAVGTGFKLVRRKVRSHQTSRRRQRARVPGPAERVAGFPELPVSAGGVDAVPSRALRGREVFSAAELTRILVAVERLGTASGAERAAVTCELRAIGFYVSDWSEAAMPFDGSRFNELIDAGTSSCEPSHADHAH